MAKIPLYTERETYTGKSGKAFTLEGERSRALEIPFVESKGLESVASALSHIGDKMTEAEELDQYNTGLISMKKGADRIVEEADTQWRDYDLEEHMDAFNDRWDQLQTNLSDGIKSNNTKRALAVQLEATRLGTMAEVRGMAHKRTYDRLLSNSITAKETHLNDAIDASSDVDALNSMSDLYAVNAGLVKMGAIDDERAAADNEKFESLLNVGYMNRFVEENNKFVIEDGLKIRTPKDVRELLNKQKLFRETDELDKNEIVKHAFAVYKDNSISIRQARIDNEKALKKKLDDQDYYAIQNYNNRKINRDQLNELADYRLISREMYEKIHNDMEGYDKNPTVYEEDASSVLVGEIATSIERGEDVSERLLEALYDNLITRDTYISYKTQMISADYKRGLRDINTMYKPLPYETITQDQAQRVRKKHADAIRYYHTLLKEYFPQASDDESPPKLYTPVQAADTVNQRRREDEVIPTTKDITIPEIDASTLTIHDRLKLLNQRLGNNEVSLNEYLLLKKDLDEEYNQLQVRKKH